MGHRMSQSKTFEKNLVCQHGCFGKLAVNGEPESESLVKARRLTKKYVNKRAVMSASHPQANRTVKRGHKLIVRTLAKTSQENRSTERTTCMQFFG